MKTPAKILISTLALATAGMIASVSTIIFAADAPNQQANGHTMPTPETSDPHAHHHMMMQMPETTRRMAKYTIPLVSLMRDDGEAVSLQEELDDGRPVVLNFIYTTCTAVCPLVSKTLSQLQQKLGADRDRVHLVSISIDPEEDTPARLAAYAEKYGAGPEWQHYTGTRSASITAQRAFDAYRGDKMNHTPVTFLRAAPEKPWIRIEGFATADDLLGEVRNMLPSAQKLQSLETKKSQG